MGHIFISYSRRDSELVDKIVGRMESAGLSVWIDREDIKAGKSWRIQIVQAVDTCNAFVLMLSSHSAASDNVRREIDLAQDSGRPVFIIRLDAVKLPAEMLYQLVGLQHVDLQTLGVDKGVDQLIETLKEHLATLGPVPKQSIRQAELVFQGVDPADFGIQKREQTLNLIATLTQTPQSQLDISNLTIGVHAFVDMPAAAAFELKTRALNRDRRLKKFGIKSLRLVGDTKYVNVSFGILTSTATIGFLNSLWMSVPSLLPSIFGPAVGKAIVITSAVVVTTTAGIVALDDVIHLLNPTPTTISATNPFTPTPDYSMPNTGDRAPTITAAPIEINAPSISGAPIGMPTQNGAIVPTRPATQYVPNIASAPTPFHPSISALSPMPPTTMTSTPPPTTAIPIAQIVSVECSGGLALYVHIRITNEAGIGSYSVWSTWGGGGEINRTFSAPLPTVIDEMVVHEHAMPDPVDRNHEIGLSVTTPSSSQPIYTYASEPGGRCPGHYQPPIPTATPSSPPTPNAQILSVECGAGLTLYVHIRITNEAGISSYGVWSTWGGGGEINQTFSAPLPTVIDQVVEHTHTFLDQVDRQHEVGLKVTTPDNSQPIFTYAMEPDGRCQGHYDSGSSVTLAATDTPPAPSGLQVTGTSLQANPVDYAGACPVRITFSGSISVDSSGTVSYQFIRSDGSSGQVQTLIFDGPGSQNVSTTWDIGAAGMTYSGWQSIQIVDPQSLTSNQAAFSIQCQ